MYFYLIIGLVFVCIFLACYAMLYVLSARKDPVAIRLKNLEEDNVSGTEPVDVKKSIAAKAVGFFRTDPDTPSDTKLWLSQAGYFKPQAVYDYYGYRLISAIVFGIVGALVSVYFRVSGIQSVLLTAFGILLGAFVPKMWVSRKIYKRRETIRRGVPNMLDLLVVCVEAGLSFTAAIHKLADEMRITCRPLAEELRIVTQEILIGKSKADAFRNLANRTGVEELRSLAVTLIQADKLGTSIASSLRVLAESMRFKRRQRAEEAANKTAVKLVFPLVFLIFPELLVILVGPAMINIVKTLMDVAQ
jgi:tight adherence protein C